MTQPILSPITQPKSAESALNSDYSDSRKASSPGNTASPTANSLLPPRNPTSIDSTQDPNTNQPTPDPEEPSEMTGRGMVTAVSPLGSTAFARRPRRYGKLAERRRDMQSVATGHADAEILDDNRGVVRKYWPIKAETSYFPIVQTVAVKNEESVQKDVRRW